MKLFPPTIVESLSVCSRAVRLTGQLRSATIEIFVDGNPDPVGSGTAEWGDEWFPLLPTVSLAAGQLVRVRQILDGAASPLSSHGTKVLDRGSVPAHFDAPLVACSRLAVISHMLPGATAPCLGPRTPRAPGRKLRSAARSELQRGSGRGSTHAAAPRARGSTRSPHSR